MSRVFLSHTSADKPIVREAAAEFANAGIRVWLDESEILPGQSLIEKISQALEETSYVAAFISARSKESGWVKKELNVALTREINGRRVGVIPIRLDDSTFPTFLEDKYYADLRNKDKWAKEIGKLLAAVSAKFWNVGKMSYYDATKAAEASDFWRLPDFDEAIRTRTEMLDAKVQAKVLWTSTWKDHEVSYAVGYKKGEKVKCFGIDHFGEGDCVLIPR